MVHPLLAPPCFAVRFKRLRNCIWQGANMADALAWATHAKDAQSI